MAIWLDEMHLCTPDLSRGFFDTWQRATRPIFAKGAQHHAGGVETLPGSAGAPRLPNAAEKQGVLGAHRWRWQIVCALSADTASRIRDSIVVSISACHAEDPGSIPGRGIYFFFVRHRIQAWRLSTNSANFTRARAYVHKLAQARLQLPDCCLASWATQSKRSDQASDSQS